MVVLNDIPKSKALIKLQPHPLSYFRSIFIKCLKQTPKIEYLIDYLRGSSLLVLDVHAIVLSEYVN